MSGLALPRGWELPRIGLGGIVAFATGTLLLAGAIHICTILLIPVFAKADGWSRLAPFADQGRFAEIPPATKDSPGVAGLDPLFVTGACRIDLSQGPAGITVDASDRFWSLALYDPNGVIIFSLNDRTAVEGNLDMVVVNADQNTALTQAPTADVETTIVAESASDDLIGLLRLYAPTRSARDDAERALTQAECASDPSLIPQPDSGG